MRIGLTGGIACGKSTVAAILRELGVPVADADEISRALTAPGGGALPGIREAFGLSYFDGEGRLDRRALADLVFADGQARARLNAIVHPLVRRELVKKAESFAARGHSLIVLDIPLLYEAGLAQLCDAVWVVSVPQQVQLARLMARDGLTREQAQARIDSQMPTRQKEALADAVIDNTGSRQALRARLIQLLADAQKT